MRAFGIPTRHPARLKLPSTWQDDRTRTATAGYDRNGNLTLENSGGGLTIWAWDQKNRLTHVAYPNGTIVTSTYSDDGHRQTKASSAGTTQFVWDGDNVLQEANSSGVTQAQYTTSPWSFDFVISQKRGSAVQIFAPDYAQNVRQLYDASGNVLDSNVFKGFGELLTTPTQTNPYLFDGNQGVYSDGNSLYRTVNRPIRTDIGRMISPDALGFTGGRYGLYILDLNNPVTYVDPSGATPVMIFESKSHRRKPPRIDPSPNCHSTYYYNPAFNTLENQIKVFAQFVTELDFCVNTEDAFLIAVAMTCIAIAESQLDPHAVATGGEGLLQIDSLHFNACASGPVCDNLGQVTAAVAMLGKYCEVRSRSVLDALKKYWGTARGQAAGISSCLAANGYSLADFANIKCSCVKCAPCPRNW